MELDKIYNADCLEGLKSIPNESVDLVLTDIPYNACTRESNGLRNLDFGDADIGNFDVEELTATLCDKTNGSIYMFCGFEQFSHIVKVMNAKGLSVRTIVWEKTNPSPMNGEFLWLSGIEMCVYGKKKGAVFNEHCKNSVLRYPIASNGLHPTMKPLAMFEYLVRVSTNKGGVILDPFMGSGTTAVACVRMNRHYIGFELNKCFYDIATERIKDAEEAQSCTLFDYEY